MSEPTGDPRNADIAEMERRAFSERNKPEAVPELQKMERVIDTLSVLQKAEIDQQIATAKAYPRSLRDFRQRAFDMATLTEESAEECIYALPRDGKVIEGPSVRLAEILLSAWGNCRAGSKVVAEDDKWVTSQGIFYDLEMNVAITRDIRRRITNKSGRRYNDDMIAMTANAASAIAIRNAILTAIPKPLWIDIYNAARRIVAGDTKTLAVRRAAAFKAFVIHGITAEKMFAYFRVKGEEEITGEHLVVLRGFLSAIKDDGIDPDSLFAVEEAKAGPSATQPLQAVKSEAGPQEQAQPQAEAGKPKGRSRPRKDTPAAEESGPSSPGTGAAAPGPEAPQAPTAQASPQSAGQPRQGGIDFGDT